MATATTPPVTPGARIGTSSPGRTDRLRSGYVPHRCPPPVLLKATRRPAAVIDMRALDGTTSRPLPGAPSAEAEPPFAGAAAEHDAIAADALSVPRPVTGDTPLGGHADPLPDPTSLCCAIVRSAVEALRGERTVHQLVRWLTPSLYSALKRRVALSRPIATGKHGTSPVSVLRARTFRIGIEAAETTVVVRDDDRVRAAAVRMESHRGVWRVVALEIG